MYRIFDYEDLESVDLVAKIIENNNVVYKIGTAWNTYSSEKGAFRGQTYGHSFSKNDLSNYEETESLLEIAKNGYIEDFSSIEESLEWLAENYAVELPEIEKGSIVVAGYVEALNYLEDKKIGTTVFIKSRENDASQYEKNNSIEAVLAIGPNGEFGNSKTNKMPWHLDEELKHFKELTDGHMIYMGRKTYESVGLLYNRETNVITRRSPCDRNQMSADFAKGKMTFQPGKHFVIGGVETFKQLDEYIQLWHVSHIKKEYVGQSDIYFTLPTDLIEIYRKEYDRFTYVVYERNN